MTKPKQQSITYFDFCECTGFIEAKYKINTRDYASSHSDFERWCKQVGEKPTRCPAGCDGEILKAHQEQFARYQADAASGKFKDNPYQDFWHWLTDVADIHRGGMVTLDPGMGEDAEPWQQHILGLYLKEFGTGPYLTDW